MDTLLFVPDKGLARIILDSVRQKLLTHRRHEQSGFTIYKKSTIDRTLAVRVFTEHLRDFRTGLPAAYVDLRKAFDSVNRYVLWRILALRGIPPKLVDLISGLSFGTQSARSCNGFISDYFPFTTVVRQGCVFAPTFFNTSMDHVLGKMKETSGCRVSFGSLILTLQMTYSRRHPKFLRDTLFPE